MTDLGMIPCRVVGRSLETRTACEPTYWLTVQATDDDRFRVRVTSRSYESVEIGACIHVASDARSADSSAFVAVRF